MVCGTSPSRRTPRSVPTTAGYRIEFAVSMWDAASCKSSTTWRGCQRPNGQRANFIFCRASQWSAAKARNSPSPCEGSSLFSLPHAGRVRVGVSLRQRNHIWRRGLRGGPCSVKNKPTLQRIGIRQPKDRDLSRAIRRAQPGQELIVTDRGVPVARIVPIAQTNPPAAIKDLAARGLLEYRAPLWEKMGEPIPCDP